MKFETLQTEFSVLGISSAFRYTFPISFSYEGEKHDGWEFVYVESGKILAKADNKKYVVNSGEIICHKPMEYHNLNAYRKDATVIIFCFNCENDKMAFFENKILSTNQLQRLYLNEIVSNANEFFVKKEPLQISKEGFMQKNINSTSINSQTIKNTIELLILSLYSSKTTERQKRIELYSQHLKRKNLTLAIKEYLEKNIGGKFSLLDIANTFSYSVSSIKTIFKNETGYSIMEYYNRLRLNYSKNLLLEKEHSISEIAEILGFNSSSHFSNFFKEKTNISPKEFMKNIK